MRQRSITRTTDDVGSGLAELFEQNLICLDDSEIGVMRQNDVMDRIEGVDPLALRAQYLFEQSEVFDGNG